MMNLVSADLLTICITISLEIGWRQTISWETGEFGCKLLQFLRTYGVYLSSFVLMCISIDRYYSLVRPLEFHNANKRNFRLLTASWILSFLFSLPQVRKHEIFAETTNVYCSVYQLLLTEIVGLEFFGLVFDVDRDLFI